MGTVARRQLTLQHQILQRTAIYQKTTNQSIKMRRGKMTNKTLLIFSFIVLFSAINVESKPQFDFGSLFGNAVSSSFNTAFGRDCKGRPQGDYFFGCQCVGPFSVGRKKRSPLFLNSNQGVGGDFLRCSLGSLG